jgi:hypothetical protein
MNVCTGAGQVPRSALPMIVPKIIQPLYAAN